MFGNFCKIAKMAKKVKYFFTKFDEMDFKYMHLLSMGEGWVASYCHIKPFVECRNVDTSVPLDLSETKF